MTDRTRDDNDPRDRSDAEDFLSDSSLPAPNFDALGEVTPKTENNLEHDAFDRRLYEEILAASEELSGLASGERAFETLPALLEDFFYALFKVRASLVDEEEVAPEHARVNRPFVERLMEDERTAILRISTTTDDLASALGALEAGRRVLQEIEARSDLLNWIEPPEQEDPADPAPQPDPRELRRTVREALDSALGAVDEHQQALAGWGLEPGDLKKVPLGERLSLARALKTPEMAAFTALLGDLRNLAFSETTTRLISGMDELHSITTGGPLERILPQELASGLASDVPELTVDFYRKMAEGTLLSYELTSTEGSGKGPIVALVDSSASMAGPPMDWATALAAALAQGPAARENRSVYLIYFNTAILQEISLSPGERDPKKLLAAATAGASGGTDYDGPLKRALQIVRDEPDSKNADLVLVTDGQCALSQKGLEDLNEARTTLGLSLYAVLCGPHADARDLVRYAARIFHAEKDLASSAAGGRIAGDLYRAL